MHLRPGLWRGLMPGLLLLAACRGPAPVSEATTSGVRYLNEHTLVGEKNFITGYETRNADGTYNIAVEIPTGTSPKWETCTRDSLTEPARFPGCTEPGREMVVERKDGQPRLMNYLGTVGNYGAMPKTLSGDGDPLDVIAIGPPAERGTIISIKVIGVLPCVDSGEGDDKIVAISEGSPLYAQVSTASDLDKAAPKSTDIIRTWYENYKGPGVVTCQPFADEAAAVRYIENARAKFAQR